MLYSEKKKLAIITQHLNFIQILFTTDDDKIPKCLKI